MKNKIMISFLFLIVISSIVFVQSAEPYQSGTLPEVNPDNVGSGVGTGVEFVKSIGENISPLFEWILGSSQTSELGLRGDILIRIIFFTILVSLLWITLSNVSLFNEKLPILGIISVGISILITRGIFAVDALKEILMPYTALGITLISVIPFIIFFIFVERGFSGKSNRILRKILWAFYGAIFFAMWFNLRTIENNYAWVYTLVFLLSILMFIFDGTIQRVFAKAKVDRHKAVQNIKMLDYYHKLERDLNNKYREYLDAGNEQDYRRHFAPTSIIRGHAALQKDLYKIHKRLSKLS